MGFWGSAPQIQRQQLNLFLNPMEKKILFFYGSPVFVSNFYSITKGKSHLGSNNQSELLSSSFTKTINGWSFFFQLRDLLKLTKIIRILVLVFMDPTL